MPTIITKEFLRAFRIDLDRALADVAARHRLGSLKALNIKFDPSAGNFRVQVEGVADDGGMSQEAQRYELHRRYDADLPPRGTLFRYSGHTYEVAGSNTTGTKVVARRTIDDKRFNFLPQSVKQLVTIERVNAEARKRP